MPFEVIHVDCGDEVLCDVCNDSYTDSDEIGGCLIGSYAICPDCMRRIKAKPDQVAEESETFRDFVLRIRKQ